MKKSIKAALALAFASALVLTTAASASANSFSYSNHYIPQCNAYYDWSGENVAYVGTNLKSAHTYREAAGCSVALQAKVASAASYTTTYTTSVSQAASGSFTSSFHRYGGTGRSLDY
ncbi:hypothetical protein [Pseudolysinimonas sp.]